MQRSKEGAKSEHRFCDTHGSYAHDETNEGSKGEEEKEDGDGDGDDGPSHRCRQQKQEEDKSELARRLYRGEGLAPMVRCGTTPLRALALRYGADFVYTEEIVDRSLLESKRVERTLPLLLSPPVTTGSGVGLSKASVRVVDYEKDAASMNAKVRNKHDGLPPLIVRIDPQLEKSRLVCQLGTSDPDSALQAALRIYRDVSAVDVNMGCPKKFSTSGGMGSALLSDPQRAASIIRKLDSHLPVPISAKIRLLPGPPVATVEFASALIDAGASAVAIHGRRVGDLDVHDSDRDALKQVASVLVQKFPSVPICANGDFYTRSEFQSFRDETLASAVLLARPALYNASIFIKPGNHVNGNRNGGPPSTTTSSSSSSLFGYDSPLLLDRTRVVQEYVREAVQYQMHYKNVKYVVCEMLNLRRTPSSRVHALTHRDVQQQQHSSFPISSSSLSPRLPFQRRPFVNSSSAAATNDGTTTTSSSSWMRPTIAQTCACKTLEEICDLWEVSSSFFSDVIDGDREDGYREDGCGRSAPDDDIRTSPHGGVKNQDELRRPARCVAHQQSHHPAGEHTYLDSYILQNAVESAAAAAVIVTSSSSSAPSTSSARRDQNSDDCEGKTSPDGTTLLNPKKPRVEED